MCLDRGNGRPPTAHLDALKRGREVRGGVVRRVGGCGVIEVGGWGWRGRGNGEMGDGGWGFWFSQR